MNKLGLITGVISTSDGAVALLAFIEV